MRARALERAPTRGSRFVRALRERERERERGREREREREREIGRRRRQREIIRNDPPVN
jgi:hypothetical protein